MKMKCVYIVGTRNQPFDFDLIVWLFGLFNSPPLYSPSSKSKFQDAYHTLLSLAD